MKAAALTIVLAEAERVAARLEASKQQTWALANVLRGFTEVSAAGLAPRCIRARGGGGLLNHSTGIRCI